MATNRKIFIEQNNQFCKQIMSYFSQNKGNIDFCQIEEFVNYLTLLKELNIAREVDNEEELFKNISKNIRILYLKRGTIDIN
jgi:hypothetical protein